MGNLTLASLRNTIEPLYSRDQHSPQTQEDHRTKFYERYRHEAEEYDREFIKKYDEDLNTTLIFVSFVRKLTSICADPACRLVCSPQ